MADDTAVYASGYNGMPQLRPREKFIFKDILPSYSSHSNEGTNSLLQCILVVMSRQDATTWHLLYQRFSPGEKRTILAMISGYGVIPRKLPLSLWLYYKHTPFFDES